MSRILARCGGDVLVDEGARWVFGQQSGGGGGTLLYVLGLCACIIGANGVFWTIQGARGGPGLGLGLSMLATAAVAVALFVLARRSRNAARERPVVPHLVLDFEARALLDGQGNRLASLDEVRFARVWQLASSSRALECRWGSQRRVVLRGSPFSGSVEPAAEALRTRGVAEA
jgi:hypothetical protein